MSTHRLFCLTLALAAVASLSACGGGGLSVSALAPTQTSSGGAEPVPTNTVTGAPSFGATASPSTIAAAGTLILSSAGLSTVAAGTYALDDTYTGVSQSMALGFGTLVIVHPDNSNFNTGLVYVQENPGKYVVGFVTNPETGTRTYACHSNQWTQAELQELAEASNDPTVITQPVCTKAITLDAVKRTVTYSDAPLASADNNSDKVTVSATFSWPVPEPIVFDIPVTDVETTVVP